MAHVTLVHLVFHDGGNNKNDVHILAHHGHNADPTKLYKTQMVVSGHTHVKSWNMTQKKAFSGLTLVVHHCLRRNSILCRHPQRF